MSKPAPLQAVRKLSEVVLSSADISELITKQQDATPDRLKHLDPVMAQYLVFYTAGTID